MTIEEAMAKLFTSEEFKQDAKDQTSLRMFASRYNHGNVGPGACVDLLIKYGYTVKIVKGNKIITKKK
jgi:hypothetical protein